MPTSYTLTAIDDPAAGVGPGAGTTPVSINAQGQVAGYYFDGSGQKHGFLDTNGTFTDAAVPTETLPSVSVPGAESTDVTGVNDLGQVVGYYYTTGSYTAHGFVDTDGTFTTIDFPGNEAGTFLYGINDAGQVVGSYFDPSGLYDGFVDTNGAFAIVDAPGAGSPGVPGVVGTELVGINAAGEVIGYYVDSGDTVRGFSATPPAAAQPSTILGSPGRQVTSDAADITPFAGLPNLGLLNAVFTQVSILDPNPGATDAVTIDLVDSQGQISDVDGKLFGNGLVESSTQPGAYTLSAATPATLSTELDALTFAPTPHQVAPGDTVTTTFYIRDTNSADPNQTAVDSSASVIAVARDDAPFIEFTEAGQAVSNNASIQPFSTIDVIDVDRGGQDSATITLSGEGGTLSGAGLSVTGAAGTYGLAAASSATLTAELEALTFTPANGTPGTSSTTTFSLTVSQTGAGNLSTTDNTTTVINTVQARTSTISGTQANQPTSDEAAIKPFANATITDPNPAGTVDTAEVTFGSTANGSLTDPNQATDGGVFDNGTYIIQGSASTVTAGLRGLVFTPTPHQAAPGQMVATTFTLSDQNSATFNFATFSAPTVSDSTTSVVATAVNDTPAISGTKAGQTVSNNAAVKPFSGVAVADPDVGVQDSLTIKLTGAPGTLSGTGLGQTGTAGTYSLAAASPDFLSSELDGLTFTPATDAPGTVNTTTFALVASQTAGGSTATTTDSTTSVIDTVAFQPSTISGAVANQTNTDEKVSAPFATVTIADANPGSPTETVTVTPNAAANGVLSDPNAATDGSVASGGAVNLKGTAAQVTTALDRLVFTPSAHEVAPGQQVTTGFTITDLNSAGQTATDRTTSVVTTAVNDAPTISGTRAGQTTADYVALQPFKGVSVTDPDVGTQDSLAITLKNSSGAATDVNGTLSGTGLAKTGTGTYALAAASPATLSSELDALTFTSTQSEVAAGQTVTTTFTLAVSQTAGGSTATSTDSATSVVATALNYVNGPMGGHAVLTGTPGMDVITAHGQYNAIFGKGGPDIINAGDGAAAVTLGDGNASVTLGGSANVVIGGAGNVTVTGAPGGYTAVTLGNGNDTVQVGGTHDVILLGNGANLVSGTAGMAFIATGAGNDTITLGGSGSTVNAGGGANTITGGSGGNTFVLPAASQGFDRITGFTEINGDALNLRAALAATKWNGQASTLANYLKVTDSGGSATLSIAPTGSGAATAITTLVGSGNLGLSDLISHHSIQT